MISRLIILLISLLVIVPQANAKETGGIRGKIIDQNTKSPLGGANVMVLETNLGATTDTDGFYLIPSIEEGIYKIRVSYIGYDNFIKPDIRVVRNKTTHVEEIQLTESLLESETITITAGIFQDNPDNPISNYNITAEEIKRSPGAGGDVFRAIGSLPGVSTEGGEFSAFSVRGGGPRDNVILVDNIPFSKLSHFDDNGLEGESAQGGRFSVFTTSLVDNAYFQTGGFPARYGGKNSSIINLGIKEGNYNDLTLSGHYDFLGWEANYDGPVYITQNSGLIISARQINFERLFNLIDEKGHGVPEFTDVIIKSTTDIDPNNKVSLLGIYADEKYTRTVKNVYESDDINANQLANHDNSRYLLGLNWRMVMGKAGYLLNTIYSYRDNQNNNDGRVDTAPVNGVIPDKHTAHVRNRIYHLNRDEKAMGIKSEYTYNFNQSMTLMTGLEFKRTDFDYTMNLNGTDTLYIFHQNDYRPNPDQKYLIINPITVDESNQLKQNYYAAFTEFSFEPIKSLTVNSGLRYEYYDHYEKGYISPRLSFRYQVNKNTNLNAAMGVYYQVPELYIISMDKANHDLENEKAYHAILGMTHYLSNDLKLTLEIYYKKYDDVLVRPDRTNMRFTNQGDGYASGLDINLIKRFVEKFYGQISYSYSISKRNDRLGEGYYDYEFSKPHMFNVLAGYQLNKEWSVAAKWYLASGAPTDNYVIYSNVHNDPEVMRYSKEVIDRNGRRFPTNHSLNLRIDYRIQFKYFAANLYLDIINLYDQKNISREDFIPQSGNHENEALGVLPSLGFRLEF